MSTNIAEKLGTVSYDLNVDIPMITARVDSQVNEGISEELIRITRDNHQKIEEKIEYKRDYLFDYFGFKTLQRSYLIKSGGHPVERVQHMFMRVSLGLHKSDLNSAFISYQFLSQKFFTHATPTLYHVELPALNACLAFYWEHPTVLMACTKQSQIAPKLANGRVGLACIFPIFGPGAHIFGAAMARVVGLFQ